MDSNVQRRYQQGLRWAKARWRMLRGQWMMRGRGDQQSIRSRNATSVHTHTPQMHFYGSHPSHPSWLPCHDRTARATVEPGMKGKQAICVTARARENMELKKRYLLFLSSCMPIRLTQIYADLRTSSDDDDNGSFRTTRTRNRWIPTTVEM